MSEKCPECDNGELEFESTVDGVEWETWNCNECKAWFYVPIEIVRDFSNMEFQSKPTDEPLNG